MHILCARYLGSTGHIFSSNTQFSQLSWGTIIYQNEKIPRYSQNSFLNIYLVLSMSHWLRPWEHGHIKDARSSVQWKPQRQSSGKGQVWGNWPPVPLEGSSSTPREALWEEHGPDFHVNSRISAFAEMAVFHQSRILLQCDPDYSKSLTHKQIPFQEHVHKFNLFLCPVKLA